MVIGTPKEIKISENRVGLTEASVLELTSKGHTVLIEKDAGLGSSITNESYKRAGAEIVSSAKDIYEKADMVVKVKEPLQQEYAYFKESQIIFTYLHLVAELELTRQLVSKKVTSLAYETIEHYDGSLPLLTPMSEVAGRMATQIGAFYLQKDHGGKGILLGGVTGVQQGKVLIIGGGVVGLNAAKMAVGLGAEVTILDVSHKRLEYLDHLFQGRVKTLYSNKITISECVKESDLVIGAVLIPGRKAPHLVTEDMIKTMAYGSVVVDVAVDQGGCIETCKPTNHKTPVYEKHHVLHYCVPNMPGVVARTSTYALTNATMNWISLIADSGTLEKAIEKDKRILKGVNTYKGHLTYEPVARDLNMDFTPVTQLMG